ncbi:uncharacterized protein I303_104560 [Kwoniella dejecticola CBS 10117]|uniref:Uncharacterized protein n=1 Tax=Kwoniella dejecticola CBS 10117 TaxID=1296121 RepID=A0A1A6A4Z9_9TREE|nr:uncharacterized protein I303_04463 [Kwoniella dejecticola CBS 10117]OBR85131.1 hypothetical protein I303_04463 [Kwoniella dejecticola CBS 10117]
MTRRAPPSHLTFLPPHIPTPPRGAPKYFLPALPPSLPTITRASLYNPAALPIRPSHTRSLSLESVGHDHPYESYTAAQEGTKPPWVRSRGIDLAEKELGGSWGLTKPREVVLGR